MGERLKRLRPGGRQHLQAQAARAAAAKFDRSAAEHLLAVLATALEALLVAAVEELVDLDLVLERLALAGDHRRPELVPHRPRRLETAESEWRRSCLALIPGRRRRDQVVRPRTTSAAADGSLHERPPR